MLIVISYWALIFTIFEEPLFFLKGYVNYRLATKILRKKSVQQILKDTYKSVPSNFKKSVHFKKIS